MRGAHILAAEIACHTRGVQLCKIMPFKLCERGACLAIALRERRQRSANPQNTTLRIICLFCFNSSSSGRHPTSVVEKGGADEGNPCLRIMKRTTSIFYTKILSKLGLSAKLSWGSRKLPPARPSSSRPGRVSNCASGVHVWRLLCAHGARGVHICKTAACAL